MTGSCNKRAAAWRERTWRLSIAAGVALANGCAAPDASLTPAEYVSENSTVLRQLKSYVAGEQQEGIARIKQLGREQGTAVVLYILEDPTLDDYRLEVVLARILADWKQPQAMPYLLQSLVAPDDGAVRIAAEGLRVFGDHPQVVAALEEMLSRPAARDRLTAARVLKDLPGARVTTMLADRFRGESDVEVRGVMLLRLLRGAYPERTAFLIDALADPDPGIRSLSWAELKKVPGVPRVDFDANAGDAARAQDVATLRLWLRASPGAKGVAGKR